MEGGIIHWRHFLQGATALAVNSAPTAFATVGGPYAALAALPQKAASEGLATGAGPPPAIKSPGAAPDAVSAGPIPALVALGDAPLLQTGAQSETDERWITVTAPAQAGRIGPPALTVPTDLLVDRQPRSAADILRGLPGVAVRTNSRGETIARVRGAEERQTGVFLDGTPLAVPWDGRMDLGLLPAGLLGEARVTKGAAPIEYGANTVGGVIDFRTRRKPGKPFAHVEAGSLGSGSGSLVLTERLGTIDTTLAAGGITRDAEPLAQSLPFGQASSEGRTNTDLDASSLFAAVGTDVLPVALRASLLHLDASRGIAPEGDRPASAGPRYWRYPQIDLTQATLGASATIAERTEVRLVAWHQWFSQTIDQYRDVTYTARRTRQEDRDRTLGGRMTLTHPAGPVGLRWAASAQSSTHVSAETALPGGTAGPRLRYRQNLYSLGVEADAGVADGIAATFGAAYDRAETPLTGDKPRQPSLDALAASAAVRFDLTDAAVLTLSGGRRTRFPTARELFGEALGRFAINPDLRPEQAWLADAELRWSRRGLRLTVNPFLARSQDTLAQRVLPDGRRQRFNLSGATSYGIDALLTQELTPRLRIELAGSVLEARADRGSAAVRRLPQRPSHEAFVAIDWNLPDRFDVRAELQRIGGAIDLDARGEVVRLAAGTLIALRAAVPVAKAGGGGLWLTGAIDNATDASVFPQAGLPLPGRVWRIGLRRD
jgi:iron complex outermembrane recepter protein